MRPAPSCAGLGGNQALAGIDLADFAETIVTDEPDNLTLRFLRRIDEKIDRLTDDVHDLKTRMTAVERQLGDIHVAIAGVNGRIDKMEARLDRIERRLDLVPQS